MKTQLRVTLTAAILAFAIAAAACGTTESQEETGGTVPPETTTSVPAEEGAPEQGTEAPQEDIDLEALLERVVADTDLPAVGVTVFDGETIIESAVAGLRRSGDLIPVELTDKFSIGSNTKAMTATLVATYVDEGVLSWETTVADVFGDVLPDIDESMAQVTVRQLLSHTAGFDDGRAGLAVAGIDGDLPVTEQRSAGAGVLLAQPGQLPTGQYAYSNLGYTMVGAMLEQLTGSSWEDLLKARVFDALGMDSCGFYAPGTPGEVDQPWGHLDQRSGEAIDPGHPDADLPHVIAPAGLVHCSMADWTMFLQSQLRGFQGSDAEIISPEALDALQTPPEGSDYALGWITVATPGGLFITHDGSNHRFTSEALLLPDENLGMLVVTNLGKGMAAPALESLTETVFARHVAPNGEHADQAH